MKPEQTEMDFYKTGQQLRDEGIKQALDSAEKNTPTWQEQAYSFLLTYIKDHNEFMAEEVRAASEGIVPLPPSNRAWGGIIRRAAIAGLIVRIGFRSVKNPKAHCAPCTVWKVVKT